MANILGSLLVHLGLNSSEFTGGLDKASYAARAKSREISSALSSISREASKMFSLLNEFGGSVGQALADAVGPVKELVTTFRDLESVGTGAALGIVGALAGVGVAATELTVHMMNLAQGFVNTSAMTGLSIRDTQIWDRAAKEAGVSSETLAQGIGRIQMQIGRYIESGGRATAQGGTFVRTMMDLGIAMKAADGSMRPMNDILLDFADKLNQIPDAEERNAVAIAAMSTSGRAFVGMVNTAREEGVSLRDTLKDIGNSWMIMSDQQIKSLMEDKKAWDEFTRHITAGEIVVEGAIARMSTAIVRGGFTAMGTALAAQAQRAKEALEATKPAFSPSQALESQVLAYNKEQNQLLVDQAGAIMEGSKAKYELIQLEKQYTQEAMGGVAAHGKDLLELAKRIAALKETVKLEESSQKVAKAPTDEVAKHTAALEAEIATHQRFAGALGATSAEIDRNKAIEQADGQVASLRNDLLAKEATLQQTLADAKRVHTAQSIELARSTQKELDFVRSEISELDKDQKKWEDLAVAKAQTAANDNLYTRLVAETEQIKQQTDAINADIAAKTAQQSIEASVKSKTAGEEAKAVAGGSRPDVMRALADAQRAMREEEAAQAAKTADDEHDASMVKVKGIELETAAIFKNEEARREAAAQAEALRYAQAHPKATAEQLAQEAADVKAVSDAEYEQSIAKKAASLDARRDYQDEITMLERIREKYGDNRDVILAINAQEHADQIKLQHDLDETAMRYGNIGQALRGLIGEVINEGAGTQGKFFSELETGLNGFEDSMAKFIVTGRGGFLQVIREMEVQLIKLGLQFLLAAAMQRIFGSQSTAAQTGNIATAQIARQAAIGQAAAEAATAAAWGGPGAAIAAAAATEAGLQGVTALEKGGDMVPGHAYLVGEKHPEILVAGMAGHVYPSVGDARRSVPEGSGSPGDTHIHVNHSVMAIDSESFKGVLETHSDILAGAIQEHMRRRGYA